MKRRNPWVSIADLLSSVVLILLLLFVIAIVTPKLSQENQKHAMMQQLDQTMTAYKINDQTPVKVDIDAGKLEFTDVTFPSGSAVLNPATNEIIRQLAGNLKSYIDENPKINILIEGHTDPSKVQRVKNAGGYFEDNIQLSTLRAANFRKALLQFMGEGYDDKIGVAGYGETRLRNKENKLAPENRRIEIRILWDGKE